MAGPSVFYGSHRAPFPSESAAVQAWIDGEPVRCRYCPEQITRRNGRWFHRPGWFRMCRNRVTRAAPKVAG